MLVLGAVFMSSCEKELNLSPTDQFDDATFWTNETNALLALTGAYRGNIVMNEPEYQPSDWWSYNGLIWLELATDNAYHKAGDNSPWNRITNGNSVPNLAPYGSYWSNSYAKIARCTDFLENIEKVQMDETKKKRMIAEVRFLRACQYYYMSQFWGSVPLVEKVLTKEEANTLSKAPKQEIVAFTLQELEEAVIDLPRHKDIVPTERGRASMQTALAFLGRMQMAEGMYVEAAATYKTIIDFGDNIIDPEYGDLFKTTGENSNEILFSTQRIENINATSFPQHFTPSAFGGFHVMFPLGSLVESYQFNDGTPFSYNDPRYDPKNLGNNRDPRLNLTILYNGAPFKTSTYVSHPDAVNSLDQTRGVFSGYGMRKWTDETIQGSLRNYGGNEPVIRYSEILLSYLEAKLEAGEPIDQALLDATINRVRARASVNMPPVIITSPDLLRPLLRNERRVELALEGIRYLDLLRWKIADQVLKGDFYGAPFPDATNIRKKGNITDPYNRWFVTTKNFKKGINELWPIPQNEVSINPNLGE